MIYRNMSEDAFEHDIIVVIAGVAPIQLCVCLPESPIILNLTASLFLKKIKNSAWIHVLFSEVELASPVKERTAG